MWRYTNNTEKEKEIVNNIIKKHFKIGKLYKICGIIILGRNEQVFNNSRKLFNIYIIEEIKKRDKYMCVFCGSKHNLEVDHKDDLYRTDDKVLCVEDGQLLCAHCNVTKRGGNSSTRYDRTVPPFLEKISNEFNNDLYFWYDPRKWIDTIVYKIKKERETTCILRKELQEKDNIILKLKDDIERFNV